MATEARTITDCLGREREVVRTWPDGSYECPFCSYAVLANTEGCRNPYCFAHVSPPFPVERAREILKQREAEERERQSREEINRFRREYQAESARKQRAWELEQIAECERRGTCRACLFDNYRRVRFVKHRKACPKAKVAHV